MSGKDLEEFGRRLDELLSQFVDDVDNLGLARLMVATANGLLELGVAQPEYDADQHAVILPYEDSAKLEGDLEAFLMLKAICVPVEGVPMYRALTLKVTARGESVDLPAQAIQQTEAGVVFKIDNPPVDAQRALVGLPAVLRSAPERPKAATFQKRLPTITRLSHLSVDRPVEPEHPPIQTPSAPAVAATPEPPPEPARSAADSHVGWERDEPSDHAHRTRTSRRVPPSRPSDSDVRRADVARIVSAAHSANKFDALGVHWSCLDQEVVEARDRLLAEVQRLFDRVDTDGRNKLSVARERIDDAYSNLATRGRRNRHRQEVVDSFALEGAIHMYEKQADTAKLRRLIPEAIEAYERLCELQPDNTQAAHELQALRALGE